MSKDLKRHLGAVVRVARQRAKLTQEALAAQIARTPESVSNIERGVQLPTIETLADLGRVLGLPIADFFIGLPDGQVPSPERTRLEAKLRETARALDDRDLAIAVDQITAFLAHCSSESGKAPSAKGR